MDANNATGSGPFPMVPTTYVGIDNGNLGEVDLNDDVSGGTDSLIFNGTAGNDVIAVSEDGAGNVQIENTVNGSLLSNVRANAMASVIVRGHAGDDEFGHDGTIDIPVSYEGGTPSSGSDSVALVGDANDATVENVVIGPDPSNPLNQVVTGLASTVSISGAEVIAYLGDNSNDNLTVNLGDAATTARVDAGPTASGIDLDQVTSDALPLITFGDDTAQLNNFTIVAGTGAAKSVTFVTPAIGLASTFLADLGPDDTLVIEGSDAANDNFTIDDPDGTAVVRDINDGTVTESRVTSNDVTNIFADNAE